MTPEEMRIEIAKECGWTDLYPHHPDIPSPAYASSPSGARGQVVPDFCNDLNAMHSAEKFLTWEQAQIYDELLFTISESCASIEYKWHAPSQARAEAFLKAIGKWKAES